MPVSRPPLFAAILLTLAILIALCLLAPRQYPLHSDTSANFWYAVTGVDLGTTRQRSDIAVYDEGRFVYSSQSRFAEYMDFPYMTISEAQAAVDLPRVQSELARRAALNDPDDWAAEGYKRCSSTAWKDSVPELINFIDSARVQWSDRASRPYPPRADLAFFKMGLLHVSQAARLYWACFLFEAFYLSGIIWFAFRPYIQGASTRRKILHVAAFPFLLYLPLWFGYCNPASWYFPGGILYPYLTFPGPTFPGNFPWEFRLLAHFPPFLSVITQGRAVTYADYPTMIYSTPYQWGPANVTFLSLVLTTIIASCHLLAHFLRKAKDRRRAFPVLNVHANDPPVAKH